MLAYNRRGVDSFTGYLLEVCCGQSGTGRWKNKYFSVLCKSSFHVFYTNLLLPLQCALFMCIIVPVSQHVIATSVLCWCFTSDLLLHWAKEHKI
jgi:hypothetical protein